MFNILRFICTCTLHYYVLKMNVCCLPCLLLHEYEGLCASAYVWVTSSFLRVGVVVPCPSTEGGTRGKTDGRGSD